jgi:hypothetical protein
MTHHDIFYKIAHSIQSFVLYICNPHSRANLCVAHSPTTHECNKQAKEKSVLAVTRELDEEDDPCAWVPPANPLVWVSTIKP